MTVAFKQIDQKCLNALKKYLISVGNPCPHQQIQDQCEWMCSRETQWWEKVLGYGPLSRWRKISCSSIFDTEGGVICPCCSPSSPVEALILVDVIAPQCPRTQRIQEYLERGSDSPHHMIPPLPGCIWLLLVSQTALRACIQWCVGLHVMNKTCDSVFCDAVNGWRFKQQNGWRFKQVSTPDGCFLIVWTGLSFLWNKKWDSELNLYTRGETFLRISL